MNNNPISNVDPDGDLPFLAVVGIGAAVGVFGNGISNAQQGQGFFDGAGKAAFWGGVGAAASFGVGAAFGATGSFGHELGRGIAHGFSSGIQSELQGGSFGQGFLSGGISSGIGSGINALGGGAGAQIAGGGLGGGIGSSISGGNFFDGFTQGIAVGAFNHALHSGLSGPQEDPPGFDYNGDGVVSWAEAALTVAELGGYAFDIATFPSGEGAAFGLFIRNVGKQVAKHGGKKIYIKGVGEVSKRAFHKMKPKFLEKVGRGNFEKVVGKNPDFFVKNGDIYLKGVGGGFNGKVYNTGFKAADYIK